MMNEGFESYVKDLFNDPTHSDISIVVDQDKEIPDGTVAIPAHRLVLATMSDYFRTMLYGNFIEAKKSEIRLHGVPYSTFQQCLRFMYFGWDTTLSQMSLEEGMEFYSLASMLLMEPKFKTEYSKWLTKNVIKWEKQLWTIVSMAVESDLPDVVNRCVGYFSDVANELLASEDFRTVPLSVIRKVISCTKMNCSKVLLTKAIKCWIASNGVAPDTKEELLALVRSKKAPFFKGNKVRHHTYTLEKMELDSTHPPQDSYSSILRFQKCVKLVGVLLILEVPRSEQVDFMLKGNMDLKVDVKPAGFDPDYSDTDYNSDGDSDYPSLTRIASVAYDFSRRNLDEVTIFFPEIQICAYKDYSFTFSWIGDGEHLKIHNFGRSTPKGLVVLGESCVAGVYRTLASDYGKKLCESCNPYNDRYRSDDSLDSWGWGWGRSRKYDDSSTSDYS
ncbi:kelch repeat and BTB domain-containing protein 4 isoform X1 [Aedes albopictus]|uniref:BTB domain-containing protein n=1 Tax=Aedes albopictus TaxID=7160 RepID=A0ABM1XZC4_AEDAL